MWAMIEKFRICLQSSFDNFQIPFLLRIGTLSLAPCRGRSPGPGRGSVRLRASGYPCEFSRVLAWRRRQRQ